MNGFIQLQELILMTPDIKEATITFDRKCRISTGRFLNAFDNRLKLECVNFNFNADFELVDGNSVEPSKQILSKMHKLVLISRNKSNILSPLFLKQLAQKLACQK